MIVVKYVTGTGGEEHVLNQSYEIMISSCNPHTSEWKHESTEKKYGISITSFGKDAIELPITLKYRGRESEIYDNLDNFFSVTERDIINMTPGRLYIGGEYANGYFIERSTQQSSEFYGCMQETTFLAPYPFWIHEESRSFPPISPGSEGEESYLDYEHDYPYDYTMPYGGDVIWNVDHYAPCEFLMTIFGPAVDPRVVINGHPYQVYTTLDTNEYLKIDSRENKVIKYLVNGIQQDIYDLRAKQESVFDPITPGNISVVWPGDFGFDLTLFCERSEPRWKTRSS